MGHEEDRWLTDPCLQKTEEGPVRVSPVQQQAPNLAGAYPVCSQAFVPRAGLDEHCRSHVYQPVRRVRAVRSFRRRFLGCDMGL